MRWIGNWDADLFLDGAEHGSFEAGKRKIKIFNLRVGKVVFFRVAVFGGFGNRRPAWVGKTKDFGDFIETFANGIVVSGADDFEVIMLGHSDDLGVAAGDD